MVKSINFNEF